LRHFVTIFNYSYLPFGISLYLSMERNINDFTLWVICVDKDTYNSLDKLSLTKCNLVMIDEIENKDLLEVKSKRTIGEYCWTMTPFLPEHIFKKDNSISEVTYLDADLWFRKNPEEIFDEFNSSSKKVLITDHGYAPEYDSSAISGQFCVQFMIFKRNGCEEVLKWWKMKCLEWCYSYYDKGRFGDQKYLDTWPVIFKNTVHVLSKFYLAMAPWNASVYPYGNSIFWHFHGLKILSIYPKIKIYVGPYYIPSPTIENIYYKYIEDLRLSVNMIKSINGKIQLDKSINSFQSIKGFIKTIFRVLKYFNSKKITEK